MPTTLADIAGKLKVAKSTVSLTLRNHPSAARFNSDLRQRIFDTARELDYRPNIFASGLSGGKSKLLLLTLTHLRDTWASMIAQAFESQAAKHDYRVLISQFHDREDPISFNRDLLGSQGVQGMVVIGSSQNKLKDEAIVELANQGVKMVLVSRRVDDPRVGSVVPDNSGGAKLAADHLYGQGMESVWVLGRSASKQPTMERVGAFTAAASEWGRPSPIILWAKGYDPITSSSNVVQQQLTQGQPQGLFACGDNLAVGAVQAFHEAGLVVGKDVGVIGFDGSIYSECCSPRLTSVRQPTQKMGTLAANMLIGMLEKEQPPAHTVVPLDLVVRKSSVLKSVANISSNKSSQYALNNNPQLSGENRA